MSISCDVIVRWGATPEQLAALGAALWRWCRRAAGGTDVYQYLDNQGLTDLIAGRFPSPGPADGRDERPTVHVGVRDGAYRDLQAAVESLRHELPAGGIEDVLVEAQSWNLGHSERRPGRADLPLGWGA
jgi:hypothetical protein